MKFLCDMPVSHSTSKWLIDKGHDSIHARELGLEKASDDEIMTIAEEEGRVIVTCDLDFGDLMAASGDKSPSVIIFRLDNYLPDYCTKNFFYTNN